MYKDWELCIVANGVIFFSVGIIIWIASTISKAKKCVKSAVLHIDKNDQPTNHIMHEGDSDNEVSKLLTQLRFDILRMSTLHDNLLPSSKNISNIVNYRAWFSTYARDLIVHTKELQEKLRYDIRY